MNNGYYQNGEPILKDRMEDEEWYADYQLLMEIAVRETFSSSRELLSLFTIEAFDREPTPEDVKRYGIWAELHYQKMLDERF